MKRTKKKIFLKYFLILIIFFISIGLLLWLYNHYLLDSSLANLENALRSVEKQKEIKDIQKIADILNDTFLNEITKEDFDLALALKLEVSAQALKQAPKEAVEQTERFMAKLDSASNIEFAASIASGASRQTQAKDVVHFVEEAIRTKVKAEKKNPFRVKIDSIVASIFPAERRADTVSLQNKIKKIEQSLSGYKGEDLQAKYLEIAKAYLLLKDWDKTESYINKIVEINNQSQTALKARFFLGILYKIKGNFKEASAIFNSIKKDFPQKMALFSAYQEADCLYKAGETEKAAALLEEIYDKNKTSEIGDLSQFRAAYIYLYDLNEAAKAKEAFAKLSSQASLSDIQPYIEHKINSDIARQYCESGFKLIAEGYRTSAISKYKEALDQFDLALKIAPKSGVATIGKALSFCFLKEEDKALQFGSEAKRNSPRDAEVSANLGFIYYTLRMFDQAIVEFEEAVNLNPNSDIFHYDLGTLYSLKQNYSKARRHFSTAIMLNHRYTYAYNNLGYALWGLGEYRQAKSNFETAVALKPDYVDAHYNLGAIYFALGNLEESRQEFLRVEQLQPGFRKTKWFLEQIRNKVGY